tara:strand:- start:471 stop:644 length:174 start_codon:yes stop_codon:yes gene_type:complete
MNLTVVILLCTSIAFVLILFPLIVSKRAEKADQDNKWGKIKKFDNKINQELKNKRNK